MFAPRDNPWNRICFFQWEILTWKHLKELFSLETVAIEWIFIHFLIGLGLGSVSQQGRRASSLICRKVWNKRMQLPIHNLELGRMKKAAFIKKDSWIEFHSNTRFGTVDLSNCRNQVLKSRVKRPLSLSLFFSCIVPPRGRRSCALPEVNLSKMLNLQNEDFHDLVWSTQSWYWRIGPFLEKLPVTLTHSSIAN